MGLHNFAAGEVLTDADMDELATQTVIPCTAFPGSPQVGMTAFRTDRLLYYVWNGTTWRSLPKGIITKAGLTAAGPINAGSAQVLSNSELTWNAVGGETYEFSVDVNAASDAVTLSLITVGMQYNGGGGYVDVGVGASYAPAYNSIYERITTTHLADIAADVSGAKMRAVITCTVGYVYWMANTPVSLKHVGTT